uniref:Uncharacterized protein n=2 Tax=Picea TaxID=3328 RepID=A0A101M1F7_PICGL|nr:hypothetical protein ABT39_MTgene3706 [Picea glauca]QHR90303.1 hypothetical protein Q903MT_gene4326 [Picea sitchensis]
MLLSMPPQPNMELYMHLNIDPLLDTIIYLFGYKTTGASREPISGPTQCAAE